MPDAPHDPERPGLTPGLLAHLDAGLLEPAQAARVRAAAAADPRAAAVLDALAATRADLAALPARPAPTAVAARWSAALAEAAAGTGAPGEQPPDHAARGPVPDGPPADGHPALVPGVSRAARWPRRTPPGAPGRSGPPSGPGRTHRARPALVTAVLLAAVVAAGVLWPRTPPDRLDLVAAGRAAVGLMDVGPLIDPTRRAGCLAAVAAPGVAPDAVLLGGRRVDRGILLVLGTGELGVFHVVVVDPGCGPGRGILVDAVLVGR